MASSWAGRPAEATTCTASGAATFSMSDSTARDSPAPLLMMTFASAIRTLSCGVLCQVWTSLPVGTRLNTDTRSPPTCRARSARMALPTTTLTLSSEPALPADPDAPASAVAGAPTPAAVVGLAAAAGAAAAVPAGAGVDGGGKPVSSPFPQAVRKSAPASSKAAAPVVILIVNPAKGSRIG